MYTHALRRWREGCIISKRTMAFITACALRSVDERAVWLHCAICIKQVLYYNYMCYMLV